MWVDQRGSEIIPLSECLRLLALAAKEGCVGRLAVSRHEAPLVQPVNFAFSDRRVLVRLGPGAMASAATGDLVAFEVDHLDRGAGAAWSVLVRGLALVVEDDGAPQGPRPLVPSPGDVVLAIRLDVVTGRRFTFHAIPERSSAGEGTTGGGSDEAAVDSAGPPGDSSGGTGLRSDMHGASARRVSPAGTGLGAAVSGGANRTPVP